MRNRFFSTAAMLVAACMILTSCQGKEPETKEETVLTVNAKKAKKKELVLSETYVGKASAQAEVTIYPTASGEVLEVDVKLGDKVQEGQRLFKLDDEGARLTLRGAQAQQASAQASANATLGGQQALTDLTGQQQIDSLERAADTAERSVTEAEHNIDRAERSLENAEQDRDKAKKDYDDALSKYHKAKSYYEDLKDLCDDDATFSGVSSLSEASSKAGTIIAQAQAEAAALVPSTTTTTTTTTTSTTISSTRTTTSSISASALSVAEDIMDMVEDVNDEGDISIANISASGVEGLKTSAEGYRTALINQRRAVDSAKDSLVDFRRNEKNADDQATNTEASLEDAKEVQELKDGQVLEDTKRSLAAGLASSAVAVEQAQYQLSLYETTAPISGVVESIDVEVHDNASPAQAAMVIANKDSMKIEFSVPQNVRDNLYVGQSVRVKKDDSKFKGSITEIGETLDSESGLFKIKAVINGGGELLSGSSVTVKVDSYRDDSGIVVPYDCVYYSNGEPFVYVIENGVAVRKDVTTGMFDEKHIVIIDGVKAGDQVITSWSSDLRDGVKVQVEGENSTDSTDTSSESGDDEQGKAGE